VLAPVKRPLELSKQSQDMVDLAKTLPPGRGWCLHFTIASRHDVSARSS